MMYKHDLIFYQNITPLHIGCGQDVGVVDLPIIRERATGYPFIPGSSIRGVLRDFFENDTGRSELTKKLFGPSNTEMNTDEGYAGCLSTYDARILLYPVRTDKKIFCWITSPFVLARFNRDIKEFSTVPLAYQFNSTNLINPPDDVFIGSDSFGSSIHLEEFNFKREAESTLKTNLATWANLLSPKLNITDLNERLLLVSDQSFWYFVNNATMIMQHNALTSAKTVKTGALFSVEALPPESVLYGFFGTTKQRKPAEAGDEELTKDTALAQFRLNVFGTNQSFVTQIGGNESTGLGVTKLFLAV